MHACVCGCVVVVYCVITCVYVYVCMYTYPCVGGLAGQAQQQQAAATNAVYIVVPDDKVTSTSNEHKIINKILQLLQFPKFFIETLSKLSNKLCDE